jgi:hypothetical protein
MCGLKEIKNLCCPCNHNPEDREAIQKVSHFGPACDAISREEEYRIYVRASKNLFNRLGVCTEFKTPESVRG